MGLDTGLEGGPEGSLEGSGRLEGSVTMLSPIFYAPIVSYGGAARRLARLEAAKSQQCSLLEDIDRHWLHDLLTVRHRIPPMSCHCTRCGSTLCAWFRLRK